MEVSPSPRPLNLTVPLLDIKRTDEALHWLRAAESAFLASVREGGVHYYHHLADLYADAINQPAVAVQWGA